MKKNKGVSTVVATVLIILITVASVTFLGIIVNSFLGDKLELGNLCEEANDMIIESSSGYTCLDPDVKIASIHLNKGPSDVNISGVEFYVSSDGNTKKFTRSMKFNKNSGKTFYLFLNGDAESISVAPVVNNGKKRKACDVTSAISLSRSCDASEGLSNEFKGIWRFDYLENGVIPDATEKNAGTLLGNTHIVQDSERGSVMSFDGIGDNIQIAGSLGFGNNAFTISHWIKTSIGSGQVYTVGNTGSGNGYRFGISGGRITFLIGNSTNYKEQSCGTTGVNDSQWHLITGVFDRGNSFECYVDGKKENSVSILLYPGMSDSPPGIGAPPCCTDFNGLMDDVVTYGRTLSEEEVKQLYEEGK
ncbi:MAG: LamG domain-containing protein [Nanoarchaeota archaeon]